MGVFTVTRKLLALWGGSTILAIAIVGGLFAYSLNAYHEEAADVRLREGFSEVADYIASQQRRLTSIAAQFAGRDDVVSSVSLVSKYQDPDTYQPLVFDAEKRAIANQLAEITGISSHHFLGVYDAQGRLMAFHVQRDDEEAGYENTGILTYSEGLARVVEDAHGLDPRTENRTVPQALTQVPGKRAIDDVTQGLGVREGNLLITAEAPVLRTRVNGETEHLGVLVVIDILDQQVMAGLSQSVGGTVSFALATDPDEVAGIPRLADGSGTYASFGADGSFAGRVAIEVGDGQVGELSIVTDSAGVLENLSVFRDSALWGMVIFIAVIAPIGVVFINMFIRRPIDNLMAGAAALGEGDYARPITVPYGDEFSALAGSFNDMARKVSEREQELIDYKDGLERTVQERTEKLKETEARTRQIINSAVDGIITTDEKGIITSFNSAAEKIFGYSVVEAVGKNVSILMPGNHADKHDEYMKRYLQGGEAKVIGMGRELVAKRKDGKTFLADFSISVFRHGMDTTFVGIIRDITERKEAEFKLQSTLSELQETQAELVQAEKMASLGGLVAGVAHEINTPIGVGLTAATHLSEKARTLSEKFASGQLKKSDFQTFIETATQSTKIVEANLNRASDLIRSFKQVAVDQTSEEKRTINVLDYVDEVLESLRPKLKQARHEIIVEGDRDIVIDTVPGPLSQVITNLVMNSVIHAYDEGQHGRICIQAERNGKTMSLTYSDDGKGMDDDVCAKIFEPFFTTKRGSGGSGLGMHILYNQVTQTLGGSIDLHSKLGRGSAFEITLPLEPVGDVQ